MGGKGRKVRSGYFKRKQRVLQTLWLLSEREGRRPGWRQPPCSLGSRRVPGTAALFSDRSRSAGPGGVPGSPAFGLPYPRISSGSSRLQPATERGSHPRSRLAVPGQVWHRVQTSFGGGSPCLCRGGESRTWHRFSGLAQRSDVERRDDFSYPARGSAASPGTIFRGGPELTGTPERSAGGWAVTATRRERRGAAGPAAADLLWGPDLPPNPEAALGRLHAGSGQPPLPTRLSPGAYGTEEDLSPGLPGGRDAPAGPQCRRIRDEGAPLPTNPPR